MSTPVWSVYAFTHPSSSSSQPLAIPPPTWQTLLPVHQMVPELLIFYHIDDNDKDSNSTASRAEPRARMARYPHCLLLTNFKRSQWLVSSLAIDMFLATRGSLESRWDEESKCWAPICMYRPILWHFFLHLFLANLLLRALCSCVSPCRCGTFTTLFNQGEGSSESQALASP